MTWEYWLGFHQDHESKMRDQVHTKIRRVFPRSDPQEMLALLDRYGVESHEQERDRVHLAILKLSDEEDLTEPTRYVEIAKRDYRDVLAWAEYPGQMRTPTHAVRSPEQQRAIVRADREQYEAWLKR